jgi:hypothetical protein
LIIQLVLSEHLKEIFHSTAYAINVYLQPGPQAVRLTRLSRDAVDAGAAAKIECVFLQRKANGRTRGADKEPSKTGRNRAKGKAKAATPEEEEEVEDFTTQMNEEANGIGSDESEREADGWSYRMSGKWKTGTAPEAPPPTLPTTNGRPQRAAAMGARKRRKLIIDEDDEDDDDVIVLSS